MKTFKILLGGIVIGIALGLWAGVNIGQDRPFYANPFEEESVADKIRRKGGEVLQEGGKALERTGEKLQNEKSE